MQLRLLTSLIAISVLKSNYSTFGAKMVKKSVEFEVFGRVQGVFFRKYTKEQADKLGLRGWCKNTAGGTVLGQLEGPEDNIETMMNWLKTKGSPASKIEKAEFRNQEDIIDYSFDDFEIYRD